MRLILLASVLSLPLLPTTSLSAQETVRTAATASEISGLEPANVLTLDDVRRPIAFRNLEKIVPSVTIPKSTKPRTLDLAARQIAPVVEIGGERFDVDAFMKQNRTSGLLVLDHGAIALERYSLGRSAQDRWASFSVTKSISSTLIGAAVADGAVKLDASIVTYLPELKGTPYDKVTVKNLIMMASGVNWNEDYSDPRNDLYSMITQSFIDHAKTRRNEHDPGANFHYNTGDANLQTLIVERATGRPAQDYLREKIWEPYGMGDDAMWTIQKGHVTGGSNIQMTLRDYGRFGQFFMEGGKANGMQVLPENWTVDATQWLLPTGFGNTGYGYTWWANRDGSYRALGIFGQAIYVNPARQVVVVFNSAWPEAEWPEGYEGQDAFVAATLEALK